MYKPTVSIDFDGPGGNTLAILGVCKRAAKAEGWNSAQIKKFQDEFLGGGREHALDVLYEFFDVGMEQRTVMPVDRGSVR